MKFKEVKPVFRIPTLILLFALMSNSTGVNAQESEILETITLTEFLSQLKNEHPLFTKERLTSEIFRTRQQSLTGAQDWNFTSSVGYFSEEPVISFASPEKTVGGSLSGGIEKIFWRTGGRLSTTITTTSLKFTLPVGFMNIPTDYYQRTTQTQQNRTRTDGA